MRHRIFTSDIAGPSIEISGDEFHHAVRVVRLREGEEIEVFDGRGAIAQGRVAAIGPDSLRVDLESGIRSRESPLRLHLGAAIIHLEKFELILQKATELGATAITPLVTDRVEIREERYRGKRDRWDKIVFEAVKQSGRGFIPRVNDPTRFDEVVKRDGPRIVFDADEEPDAAPEGVKELTVLIGPEGGWSEREIALARETRCIFQRLGPRRLRAETAAIVSLSVLASRYGDI